MILYRLIIRLTVAKGKHSNPIVHSSCIIWIFSIKRNFPLFLDWFLFDFISFQQLKYVILYFNFVSFQHGFPSNFKNDFKKNTKLYFYLEREWENKREGEKLRCEKKCPSVTFGACPNQGLPPTQVHVLTRNQPETFQFVEQHPTNWATLVMAKNEF